MDKDYAVVVLINELQIERDALRAQVAELVTALKSARLQLEGYEFEANGEDYNDPYLNALIAEAEGGEDNDRR